MLGIYFQDFQEVAFIWNYITLLVQMQSKDYKYKRNNMQSYKTR